MVSDAKQQREPSDAALIAQVRAGNDDAYATLYTRHHQAAARYARAWTQQQADADELVSESFARVLAAIRVGRGPVDGFRPYLATTMRHLAAEWTSLHRRLRPVEDITALDAATTTEDPAIAEEDRSLVRRAFEELPATWQTVLWHLEVEGEKPAQVAPLLGLAANAVSALAHRAREGLRETYLRLHLSAVATGCQPYAHLLGRHVRGTLSRRDDAKVTEHLKSCEDCRAAELELREINRGLGALVGAALLGSAEMASAATSASAVLGAMAARLARLTRGQVVAAATVMMLIMAGIASAMILGGSPAGVRRALPHPAAPVSSPPAAVSSPPVPTPSSRAQPPDTAPSRRPHPVIRDVTPPSLTVASPGPAVPASPSPSPSVLGRNCPALLHLDAWLGERPPLAIRLELAPLVCVTVET